MEVDAPGAYATLRLHAVFASVEYGAGITSVERLYWLVVSRDWSDFSLIDGVGRGDMYGMLVDAPGAYRPYSSIRCAGRACPLLLCFGLPKNVAPAGHATKLLATRQRPEPG